MSTLRKRPAERITGMLWGGVVSAAGILMLLDYSGYRIDLELAAIVALTVIGLYLLLSAALSGQRARRHSPVPAPVSEDAEAHE